jgi:hypothetical protein
MYSSIRLGSLPSLYCINGETTCGDWLIDRQSTLRCGNVSVLVTESYAIDF